MSKVIKMRSAITTALRDVHPRVYYDEAPDGAEYPYVVYHLPNSNDQGTLEQFVMDVDGWDRPETLGDSVPLETLMAAIDAALDRRVVRAHGVSMTIYRDARLSLDDDDKRLLRRKYIYEVRTYQKRRDYHGW